MVLAGSQNEMQSTPEEVAEATLRMLDSSVPSEVPGVVFLSGGQTPEQVTTNFNTIAKMEKERGGLPWKIGFSFSRGIEQHVQEVWAGKSENITAAQQKLIEVLEKNCKADQGSL
jgi:fructose-bisphosphate aldolase class I